MFPSLIGYCRTLHNDLYDLDDETLSVFDPAISQLLLPPPPNACPTQADLERRGHKYRGV
jgi:hypothetical protein